MGALDLSGVSGAQDSTLRTVNTTLAAMSAKLPAALVGGSVRVIPLTSSGLIMENTDAQLLASASRTTTQTIGDQQSLWARGLSVVLDMTVVTAGPSVTVSIDMKDLTSGKYVNLLTGLPITTISTNRYVIGPDVVAVANVKANDYVPPVWRVVVTANNANAGTYSLGHQLHHG